MFCNLKIIYIYIYIRHAHRFSEVYAASGKLFVELNQFKDRFEKWIAPAFIDIEDVFDSLLSEPEDWENALQICKKKQEEASNLSR